jgi:O-antigen ligase/polysaccharide polymerase Wzy-like membrane protein
VVPAAPARRRIWRALVALSAGLILAGLIAVTLSHRGLTGTASHAWHSFTATHSASVTQPTRLLSADSANRWVWWKEALGAFSDRPVGGWGAGSFPVVHLLYRRDTLSVNQPHSMPLQWLAETGLVGTLLAAGGLLLLLAAGHRAVRRARTPSEVAVRAALLAAAAGYLVHALYDWDWDIPGVTLPFIVCLGVLAGSAAVRSGGGHAPPHVGRAGPLALGALLLSTAAVSAAIPSIAATRAGDALVTAASGSASDLTVASREAQAAGTLDPLSDAGPRAAAAIAQRRGERRQARADLLTAIHREPTDPAAWANLVFIELQLGDLIGGEHAAERARQLDPLGPTSSVEGTLAAFLAQRTAPPQRSASAAPTP